MRVMGLVPARGGSKRIPDKNMQPLGGIPLIQWSVQSGIECGLFDDLVVSSDDYKIIDFVTREWEEDQVRVIHRPDELALDDTPMLHVVRHAVAVSKPCDVVVLLQPTSPFRTPEDIHAAFALLKQTGADAVVSMTEPEEDLVFELGHCDRMRHSTNVVVPNGAIYIITTASLDRGVNWYNGVAYAYRMPKDKSLDINTPLDLIMAQAAAEQYVTA